MLTKIKIKARRFQHWIDRYVIGGSDFRALERWITRDICLTEQWDAAYRDGDILEMERVHRLIKANKRRENTTATTL